MTVAAEDGRYYLRNDDRYHRCKVTIEGGFTHAKGVGINLLPTGFR